MKALSPLILFLVLYLVTSIVAQDFYIVPISVAFLVSALYALLTTTGTFDERMRIFASGAGNNTMVMMILIFILAGAFAASAKAMGAVDETVDAMLYILPSSMILPGVFLASMFISLSVGTSCGTIAALTPIAVGLAQRAGIDLPLMVGIVVGGTYFGDNLSFISDTTIIATQTQGCRMKDKFRVNSRIVAPVALLMLMVYAVMGGVNGLDGISAKDNVADVEVVKIIPYIIVIATALKGINVIYVLMLGLLCSGLIGITTTSYDVFEWMAKMNDGIMGMSELIVCTILAGGMLAFVKHNGGIDYIITNLTGGITTKRGAELAIAALAALVNVCTANNTVAIITAGPIARDIATRFGVDARKSASLLDTASCFTQGLLPYGAQVLIAAGLSGVTPIEIIPYLWYPLGIGIAVLLSIMLRYPRQYS